MDLAVTHMAFCLNVYAEREMKNSIPSLNDSQDIAREAPFKDPHLLLRVTGLPFRRVSCWYGSIRRHEGLSGGSCHLALPHAVNVHVDSCQRSQPLPSHRRRVQ